MEPTPDLTPETVDRLTAFLESPERPLGTLSYLGLRGYLFALANSPRLLRPAEWLPAIFGPDGEDGVVWNDEETAQIVSSGIIAVWNDVVRVSEGVGLKDRAEDDGDVDAAADDSTRTADANDVDSAAAEDAGRADEASGADAGSDDSAKDLHLLTEVFGHEPDEDVRRKWCAGFEAGWELVLPAWEDALADVEEEHLKWFDICQFCLRYFGDPEARNESAEIPEEELEEWVAQMVEIFPSALRSYSELGRALYQANVETRPARPAQAVKGPGRNDPCPCGSGKKYKKCCLN